MGKSVVAARKTVKQRADKAHGEILPTSRKKLIAFGWYGGKFIHLPWLLEHLPNCHGYCEPFGGSAAVILNRTPSAVETYNDIDGEVTNFFRVLRDQTTALSKAIALTPFSREEFVSALLPAAPTTSSLERARRFFIRARQVRSGLAQTASPGRWANCTENSRNGMSATVSRWLGSVDALPEIAARLLRVQIENRPAIEVIERFDDPGTLIYCDPPYATESRSRGKAYGFEFSDQDHIDLAQTLNSVAGKVAVSGYRCPLMNRLYRGWRRVDSDDKKCHMSKTARVESIWFNF